MSFSARQPLGRAAAGAVRRLGEWFVEPAELAAELHRDPAHSTGAPSPPQLPPRHPVVGVVGLAPGCGATTIACAVAIELANAAGGVSVVGSAGPPAVAARGPAVSAATALIRAVPWLADAKPVGRTCRVACQDPVGLAARGRPVAPTVIELQPGAAALSAAPALDHVLLVASPALEPALAEAVRASLAPAHGPALIAVNRALDHGAWLMHADFLVPHARMGARLALAGRESRGWLGRSVSQIAAACLAGAADGAGGPERSGAAASTATDGSSGVTGRPAGSSAAGVSLPAAPSAGRRRPAKAPESIERILLTCPP